MRRTSTLAAALLAGFMVLASTGCAYLQARDHLNKGIAAFKTAKYSDAVEHFKQAMELDPDWATPRLYLATSYLQQWIPGAESPENLEHVNNAKREFLKVLEDMPQDETSLASLAMIAYNEATTQQNTPEERTAKLDEAANWHKKRIEVNASNAEAHYALGVITFAKWGPVWRQARANLKMREDEPGPLKDKKVREELLAEYDGILQEGLTSLDKALEIDPEYNEAMAYKNLLIRQRADLMEDKDLYQAQVDEADMWLEKSLATARIKAERAAKAPGGIVQGN